MLKLTLKGDPRTKKNSMRIVRFGSRSAILPSKAYSEYAKACMKQIRSPGQPISMPVNLRCVYYMRTRRRVDLANLLEATCDILVAAGVVEDDNSGIIVSHDGSAVRYDKEDPRVEIEITEERRGQQD